ETSHQPTSRGLPRPIRGLLVNQAPRTQTIGHSPFVYAIDRDGRTYGEDDLDNVKETDFSFTKRGVALARPAAFSKAQDEAKRVISSKYPSVSATFTEQVDKAHTFEEIEELLDKARQDFVKLEPNSDPHANKNQDKKGNDGGPNEQGSVSDEEQK
ncbi:hypothetical protein BVL40_10245, partial [Corynebacterium diphtheriae]